MLPQLGKKRVEQLKLRMFIFDGKKEFFFAKHSKQRAGRGTDNRLEIHYEIAFPAPSLVFKISSSILISFIWAVFYYFVVHCSGLAFLWQCFDDIFRMADGG